MRTDEDDYPYYKDPNAEPEAADVDPEDDDDFEFDPLGPDEHDAHLLEDGAREDEIHCPACGELTYDDAPQCTHCGHWITEEEIAAPSKGRSIMTVLIIAAVAISLLLWGIGI
ncbi:MAG: hypothetical protein WD294_10220 [Phycisphaeraceae bacterium]